MITTNAKDLIKLREIRNKRIDDLWCETQQNDIQRLIDLMENVATAAMSCCNNNSSMGMDLLKQAKFEFVETLLASSEDYRHIASEPKLMNRRATDKLFA